MSADNTPPRVWWSPSRAEFVIEANPILRGKPFVAGDLSALPDDAVELRPVDPVAEKDRDRMEGGTATPAVPGALLALAARWDAEQAAYPPTEVARWAAAAVRCCAHEVRALLDETLPPL